MVCGSAQTHHWHRFHPSSCHNGYIVLEEVCLMLTTQLDFTIILYAAICHASSEKSQLLKEAAITKVIAKIPIEDESSSLND